MVGPPVSRKNKIPPRKQSLQQFLEVHRIPVSSLMHRPGKARRGVKVGFRFQLQDWFTSTSRQSPQVEKRVRSEHIKKNLTKDPVTRS